MMRRILLFVSVAVVLLSGCLAETNSIAPSPSNTAHSACINGNVYKECGSACPLTCENKDNPPSCIQMCVAGCFCPNGMVSNKGTCVAPSACPTIEATPSPSSTAQPACTNGNVYKECGSACPLTCENKDNPPSCIQECVAGCFCPNGMVSNKGTCVAPSACPTEATPSPSSTAQPVCTNGNVYTECGSACPLTCENKDNPPSCIQECVVGCFCPHGMVSNAGSCVAPNACPTVGQATPSPSSTARPDSNNYNLPYVTPPKSCPGDGDVEAFGACVIQSECMNIESGSNGDCDEGFLCCSTGCGGILCTKGVSPSPLCSAVRSKAMNETSGLLGAYVPQCEHDGSFSKVQCHEGYCWCVDGETGKALDGVTSGPGTLPQCGDKATTQQIATPSPLMPSPSNTTRSDSNNYNLPYVTPPKSCPLGEDEVFGACVIQSECTNIESGSNGGCDEGSLCCSTGCGGILCKKGVSPSPLCSAVRSKAMNETSGLLGAYVPQCEHDGSFSKVQCHEGYCWCVDGETGKALDGVTSGPGTLPQCGDKTAATTTQQVVTPSPSTPACTNGKVYSTCGTMCPLTCANKDNPPMICPLACKIGCVCPHGMVENGDGCVLPENCPVTNAGKPSYCELSPESGLCEAYMPSFFYNSTSKKCESFIYGGCQGNKNRFTNKSECMNACGDQVATTDSTTLPEPETVSEALYTPKKMCPVATGDELGSCVEHCTSDEDCEDWERCCSNGCGHSCMETVDTPYYAPPMQCPKPIVPICNFHFACSSHDECDEQYCCSTGCGAMCMDAIAKTPACSAIKASVQSKGLIGAYEPQCDDNGNFTTLQCHGSTGMCWCVDTLTGEPLSTPVQAEQPDCDQIIQKDKCKGIQCDWPYCGEDVQPISDDDHCCPYCPASCKVGDQTYPSGTSYTAPDGCNTCNCHNGMAACTLMACLNQCTYNGRRYNPGETFNATDGCNTCNCDTNGVDVSCTEIYCVPDCSAGGIQMNEGETKNDGCSECTCQNKKLTCTPTASCDNPVTKSIDISMKFKGDFDAISDDLEGFKSSFRASLVTKYQSHGLQESQITNLDVYRGSIVVKATLQDTMDNGDYDGDHHGEHHEGGDHDDDDDGQISNSLANITLLLVQLEQDYNSNDLVIVYQDMSLEPSGEFTYQDRDEGDDDDEEFYLWSYIGVTSVLIVTILILIATIIGILVVVKKRRNTRHGRSPLPTKDFDMMDHEYKIKGGYPNPLYDSKMTVSM